MANNALQAGLAYVVTAVDSNGKPTATKLIAEANHNWVKDAVQNTPGYTTYTCANGCGQTQQVQDCLHAWVTTGKNITDTTHEQKCSKCGAV
jgi:hypothetical protein